MAGVAPKANTVDVYSKSAADSAVAVAATPQLDSSVAAATYAPSALVLTSKSTVCSLFGAGKYQAGNIRNARAFVLNSPSSGALDALGDLLARKAATNLQSGFLIATGTVGVISSGGVLPTGLSFGSAGVVKEIMAITTGSITVKLSPPQRSPTTVPSASRTQPRRGGERDPRPRDHQHAGGSRPHLCGARVARR